MLFRRTKVISDRTSRDVRFRAAGARKNRLDLSVGIALGSATQIALFVAPVLVLLSYVIGPAPMNLQFWPGAVVMMLIATMTASLVTNSGARRGLSECSC